MAEKNERCVLCLDQKRSPVRIICGHSFCNECLDVYKSYQKYAWANRCPICRGSLKEKRRSVKKPSNLSATPTASASAAGVAPIEQVYLLEEFMAIATDSDATEEDDFSEDLEEELYYSDDVVNVDDADHADEDIYVDDVDAVDAVDDVGSADFHGDQRAPHEADSIHQVDDLEFLSEQSDHDVVIVDEIIIID